MSSEMEGWQGMYGSDEDTETVAYDEFRDLARDEGLLALDVQVVQTPGDANGRTAVVLASARTAQGVFSAVGEASPLSAPAAWHPFLTTLAELRAKARALRDLTGQEQPVREELSVPYSPSLNENAAPRMASPTRAAAPAAPRPSPNTPSTSAPALDVPRPTAPASASPSGPIAPSVAQAAEFVRTAARRDVRDIDAGEAGDDSDDSSDEEVAAPSPPAMRDAAPAIAPTPMARVARPTPNMDDDDDEIPPDGITPDTVAKLMRYATDIAAHEGTDLSDAEARQKLDDFFVRAFRHPMSHATRIEGQRVLQKLSSDLARKRTAPDEDDE